MRSNLRTWILCLLIAVALPGASDPAWAGPTSLAGCTNGTNWDGYVCK